MVKVIKLEKLTKKICATVLWKNVNIKDLPGSNGTKGEKYNIIAILNNWVQIKLNDGRLGSAVTKSMGT